MDSRTVGRRSCRAVAGGGAAIPQTGSQPRRMHAEAGADYIGCGPFRFTTTKKNLSPVLGLEGYTDIVSKMKAEGINLPIVAIGGITKEDIPLLMKTGINGIALSGSILRAENPIEEMKTIITICHSERSEE